MIYWGLAKLLTHPRVNFHEASEIFMQKTIEQMVVQPEKHCPEDPITVFNQIVQTSAVMAYTQAYIVNRKLKTSTLNLIEKSLEIRVGLAVPMFDDEGVLIPPPLNMDVEDLQPPRISQLTHIKLILTTIAKQSKAQKPRK